MARDWKVGILIFLASSLQGYDLAMATFPYVYSSFPQIPLSWLRLLFGFAIQFLLLYTPFFRPRVVKPYDVAGPWVPLIFFVSLILPKAL